LLGERPVLLRDLFAAMFAPVSGAIMAP
jgi:hypothetical protein